MPMAQGNGLSINYHDTGGDGTPVVFVHGFPLDGRSWEPQLEALEETRRAIVPDLRGFGGSDVPDDRSAYSVDSFADDVRVALDDAGVDKAIVCGLSMGGYVTFAFARKYPEVVVGLVLADTRAEPDPPEAKEKRTAQQKQVSEEGPGGLIDVLPGALTSAKSRSRNPDLEPQLKKLMDNPAAGFIGALEAMKQRPDSSSDLAGIDVPTLIIVGEDDALTPPDAARTMHEAIGGSQMVVIPEAGHFSNLESPDEFNRALLGFLEDPGNALS